MPKFVDCISAIINEILIFNAFFNLLTKLQHVTFQAFSLCGGLQLYIYFVPLNYSYFAS